MNPNPYKTQFDSLPAKPYIPAKDSDGFKVGFRYGAIWSLLVVAPVVPLVYENITGHKQFQDHLLIDDSARAVIFAWIAATTMSVLAISLPCAVAAGLIAKAKAQKRRDGSRR